MSSLKGRLLTSTERSREREKDGTGEVSHEIRDKPPAFAERQAAGHAVSVAPDVRTAELAGIAREVAEKAARDAEVARQAVHDVAMQAERKPARDARYAARKERPRN